MREDGDDLKPGRPGVLLGVQPEPLLHLPQCGDQSDAVTEEGHHGNVETNVRVDHFSLPD